MRGKVTRQRPQTTKDEEKGEPPKRGIEPTPSAYKLKDLPLSQPGSRCHTFSQDSFPAVKEVNARVHDELRSRVGDCIRTDIYHCANLQVSN